jgi:glycosyltransferase 2 family protein
MGEGTRVIDAKATDHVTEAPVPVVHGSPVDVLRLVTAAVAFLVTLLVAWIFGDTLATFAAQLLSGLDAVPTWILDTIVVGLRILGLVVLGGILVFIVSGRRWRMLLTVAAAAIAAAIVATLVAALVGADEPPAVVDAPTLGALKEVSSPGAIAAIAAILTAGAPWLGRRWRRSGWTLAIGMTLIGFVSSPVSFDALLALLVGWLTGAAVLVVAGAPSRRPTRGAVMAGLAAVGLSVVQLDRAGVDARGSTPYFGVAADGSRLFVKALGADERSADLLFRLYRRIQRRNFGDEPSFSTLRRAVEHEAFVALAVRAMGVRTPTLRAFATAEPNGYVLAYEAIDGRSLDRLDPSDVSDEVLGAVWRHVGELRHHRVAHRDLRLANIFLDDAGVVWLIDFGFSEVAASDVLLATDVAELLASSSAYVGLERAVAQAVAAVDPITLGRAVDRLRRWALSGATRTALAGRSGVLDDLRVQLSRAVDAGAPDGR